ncbi:MAG: replicative DNA helicase [Clostridiales bacterium]|jgi:replicative DNA helicase|nr:replicative DNA helicase [Clostridiales bacterium]
MEQNSNLKVPPNNIEAEQSVLGAMLLNNDIINDICEILKPEDFYRKDHSTIYEAIIDLYNRNSPVDVITVTDRLSHNETLEKVGGLRYLGSLTDMLMITGNAVQYARIILEKSVRRKLIKAATEIASEAYEPSGTIADLLELSEKAIFEISQERTSKQYFHIKDVLIEVFNKLESMYYSKENYSGIPTGYKALDNILSGMHDSDLIFVAARPGVGKTTFMLNIAKNVALNSHLPVVLFNLEMSKDQLATKILSSESRVDSDKLMTGKLSENDWTKLASSIGPLSESPIYFDDVSESSVASIRAKCRKLKIEKGIALVVVDYLQLMTSGKRSESRAQDVSEISRGLKLLAKELNVPIIVGSQLNREVEKQEGKRPMLSNLRESGSIEQDADIVMFLHRDDYETEQKNSILNVIIAKHRNGPTGEIKLLYHPEISEFSNFAEK